ncbi:MAG: DUF3667 domain-containing protein [Flavobacteriaceae bacterium]|nr:DUF3667 domain-containing protein [Flavobacteriaceae bacterium]
MNCKNCDHPLSEMDNFCQSCGAKVIRNRLALRNLIESFSEQFLNYDNKFLQTFIMLFKKPEDVIGTYIDGTRKKYVNVVSYFAIAITYAGLFAFINQKYFPGVYDRLFGAVNQNEAQVQFTSDMLYLIFEYQAFIFFLMVPVLALMSRLVFLKNKKYNYTEQIVITMYAYAQASLFVTTISFIAQFDKQLFFLNSILGLPLQILYFAYILKRMYNLNFVQIFLKTLLFLLILGMFYVLFVIVLLIYLFAFTDFFQQVIEAEKAKKGVSYIISSAINWTS